MACRSKGAITSKDSTERREMASFSPPPPRITASQSHACQLATLTGTSASLSPSSSSALCHFNRRSNHQSKPNNHPFHQRQHRNGRSSSSFKYNRHQTIAYQDVYGTPYQEICNAHIISQTGNSDSIQYVCSRCRKAVSADEQQHGKVQSEQKFLLQRDASVQTDSFSPKTSHHEFSPVKEKPSDLFASILRKKTQVLEYVTIECPRDLPPPDIITGSNGSSIAPTSESQLETAEVLSLAPTIETNLSRTSTLRSTKSRQSIIRSLPPLSSSKNQVSIDFDHLVSG